MTNSKKLLKYFLISGIILISLSCTFMKQEKPDKIELKVLNYGRSSAKVLYTKKDKNMPSGEKRTTDYKLNIIEKTDSIKLNIGNQFGIEYIIRSPSDKLVNLKTIWTFPSTMTNNEGRKFEKIEYKIDKYTNQYSYSNYTLEEPYEMIPGKWNIKIVHQAKIILNKDFYLIE